MTNDDIEAKLIDCLALWERTPNTGHRPLRSAWPESAQRAEAGDYDARGGDMVVPDLAQLPLTRDEVGERDRVSEWLLYADEGDRHLVRLVLRSKLRGGVHAGNGDGKRGVPWSRLLGPLGLKRGAGALPRRYERAIAQIGKRVRLAAMIAGVEVGKRDVPQRRTNARV